MFTRKQHSQIAQALRKTRETLNGKKRLEVFRNVLFDLEEMFVNDNPEFRITDFEKEIFREKE